MIFTDSPQCCLGKGATAGHNKGCLQVILFHIPGKWLMTIWQIWWVLLISGRSSLQVREAIVKKVTRKLWTIYIAPLFFLTREIDRRSAYVPILGGSYPFQGKSLNFGAEIRKMLFTSGAPISARFRASASLGELSGCLERLQPGLRICHHDFFQMFSINHHHHRYSKRKSSWVSL